MKTLKLFALGAICLCILPSCNEEKKATSILVGTTSKIEKATRDEYNFDLLSSSTAFLPLISKDNDSNYSSTLINYETNDNLVWALTFKEAFRWSDGEPVTAEDIVYSLKYESTSKAPAFTEGDKKGTYAKYEIYNDKKSVKLTLEKANLKFLDSLTTFRIRPKHIFENKDAASITEEEGRIGLGPYVLTNFDKTANTLTFTKNQYYPLPINATEIKFKLFAKEEVMYSALIASDIDLVWNYSTGVSKDYQTILKDKENVVTESMKTSNCPSMLTFNNKKGLFSDKNLRIAVSYALDYENFKTYFGSKFALIPNRSFVPSAVYGYTDTEKLKTDLTKANEFMANSNYVKGKKYWEKDGKIAEFSLTINSAKTAHVSYGEFVKTQLEKFGIKVNLNAVDSTLYNELTSHKFSKNGEIAMEAAIMGYTAFGMNALGGMYINGNHAVQGGAEVYSELLNENMEKIDDASNNEEYMLAAKKIQEFFAEEIPALALYWDGNVLAHSNKVQNLTIDYTFGYNNLANWNNIKKN